MMTLNFTWKKLTVLLYLIALTYTSNAQSYVAWVRSGKLWELIDESGNTIVPPSKEIRKVSPFFNGYGRALIGKQWHYVSQDGKLFTTNGLEAIDIFSEGLGAFKKAGLWGFFDTNGNIVIEPKYEAIKPFKKGKTWVRLDDYWFQIDKTGAILSESYEDFHYYENGYARVRKGGMWGFINEQGKEVAGGLIYQKNEDFFQGKAWVRSGDQWGVIDTKGNYIINPTYDKVSGFFKEDYAIVRKGEFEGALHISGKEILPVQYVNIKSFDEGFAPYREGDLWGFVGLDGTIISQAHFEAVKKFDQGNARVRKGDQWGYLTPKGQVKLLGEYDDIDDFVNGRAKVRKGDLWGYIGEDFQIAITPQFLKCDHFYTETTPALNTSDKWVFIDKSGNQLPGTNGYDRADGFFRNLSKDVDYSCNQDPYSNVLNRSGFGFAFNTSLFRAADIMPLEVARVNMNGGWAYIFKNGEVIISGLENAELFVNGYAMFRKNGKWGFINQEGKVVIEPKYVDVKDMTEVCN